MSKIQHSNGNTVRAWAVEQGLAVATTRGRLSKDVIAAFDAAHPKATYAPSTGAAKTVPVKITLLNSAGRNYSKVENVTPARLRALSGSTSTKGRLSAAQMETATAALAAEIQAAKSAPAPSTPSVEA